MMNDLLKKGFFLGLGIAAASKEKVEKYVRELVKKGKLTPREAEDLITTFIKKGEETEEKWDEKRKETIRKALSEYDIATKEELKNLEERVLKLELELRTLLNEKEKANMNNIDDDNVDEFDEIKEKDL